MTIPFGFSDSPEIFAMCTDVVQRVHHCMQASNGSWSGWGPLHSHIFADAAIFVEAEMGDISAETAEARGKARQNLFGEDSIEREIKRDWGACGAPGV